MTKPNFTDAQLDDLTEEEREGMLDESLVDDPEDIVDGGDDDAAKAAATAAAAAANAEEENNDDDGQGDDNDNDDDDTAANADLNASATIEQPKPEEAADDEIKLDTRKANWLEIDQLNNQKKALNEELLALSKQFDEGELTAEELYQKRAEIEDRRDPISTAIMRAEIGKQDAIDKWKNDIVPAFFEKNPAYAEKGGVLNTMLDAEVRKIQSEAPNPTDPKILDLALSRINKQITLATGQAPKSSTKQKPARTPKPEVPPNLGNVPAAAPTAPVDGTEYAHLDRLAATDVMAYDDALAKLTPAQLDHYLSR